MSISETIRGFNDRYEDVVPHLEPGGKNPTYGHIMMAYNVGGKRHVYTIDSEFEGFRIFCKEKPGFIEYRDMSRGERDAFLTKCIEFADCLNEKNSKKVALRKMIDRAVLKDEALSEIESQTVDPSTDSINSLQASSGSAPRKASLDKPQSV